MSCLYFSPVRVITLFMVLLALALAAPNAAGSEERRLPEGPIAYTGHGAMFDKDGNELVPTAELIREAQAFYREQLLALADESLRQNFMERQARVVAGRNVGGQARLVADSHLLEWLIKNVAPEGMDRLLAKNNAMQLHLGTSLPETRAPDRQRGGELFELPEDLQDRLREEGLMRPIGSEALVGIATTAGGEAYRNLCRQNGVPVPPDWGTSGWVSQGLLNDVFISGNLQAEVFTFRSSSPEGMCIALPRDNGNSIRLLGIICLGKASSKACFWDNHKFGQKFFPDKGQVVSFSEFGGGSELVGGDVCTQCHAGENPYVIHPGTALGLPNLSGLPLFGDSWHQPLVVAEWPQNPGPIGSPQVCAACHEANGTGGRFPAVSTELRAYCQSVLSTALGRTMPLGAPGSQQNDPEVQALLAMCNQPPPDPEAPDPGGGGVAGVITFLPAILSVILEE